MQPQYNGLIAKIYGWPTQPSLLEVEHWTTKSLAKLIAGISWKCDEKAFSYKGKNKWKRSIKSISQCRKASKQRAQQTQDKNDAKDSNDNEMIQWQ